ncbi:MAG: ThiF family adenylyltransferase [Actinomycetota bacterium]|nr:ThiF family adenylyltransferase [Actinomycetota bacterium]
MRTTLALREETWRDLLATLDEPRETAGFVMAGVARGADDLTLLARDLRLIDDAHYLKRTARRLSIGSAAIVAELSRAASDKAIPIFMHTHPSGTATPSSHDRRVDRDLRLPALIRSGQPYYMSLIIAGTRRRPQVSGRIYNDAGLVGTLERIRVVGERLRLLTTANTIRAFDSAVFDRQIRAFGEQAQKLLSQLRIGVVGAGGTGSTVFEQLVRLGVGEIVVIDDDHLNKSNLTRVHEAGIADVDELKVAVAEKAAARIGLGTTVNAVEGRIGDKAIARRLKHCDLVFGCTDDHTGRQVLSKLSNWYLIPVIDMGFLVNTSQTKIAGLFGRVTTITPGAACLVCRDYSTPDGLQAESLPPEERRARAAEGYVPGLRDRDPSVGTFTTLVASFAVAEMLDRLVDYSSTTARPTELILRLHDRKLSTNSKQPKPGHWCGKTANWGRGDSANFLGTTP